MIIFINDNSTIRSKGRNAEGDTLALARPRSQKAPLHSRSTAPAAQVCTQTAHTHIQNTPAHTHTRTHIRHNQHTRLVGRSDYRPRLGVLRCMGGSGARRWGFLIATAPQRSKGARRECWVISGYNNVTYLRTKYFSCLVPLLFCPVQIR